MIPHGDHSGSGVDRIPRAEEERGVSIVMGVGGVGGLQDLDRSCGQSAGGCC